MYPPRITPIAEAPEDRRDLFRGRSAGQDQGCVRRSRVEGAEDVRRNPEGDGIADEADASERDHQHRSDRCSPDELVGGRVALFERLGPAEDGVDSDPPGDPLRPVAG